LSPTGLTGLRQPGQRRHVLTGDSRAAVRRAAAVEHRGPRVAWQVAHIAQAGPAPVQPLERVLHRVCRCGHVTGHDQGQPDEFQLMLAEQGRYRGTGSVPACRDGHTGAADRLRGIVLHV
jgi:hypothetical protein